MFPPLGDHRGERPRETTLPPLRPLVTVMVGQDDLEAVHICPTAMQIRITVEDSVA